MSASPVVVYFHQIVRLRPARHAFLRNAMTPQEFRALMVHVKERYRALSAEEYYAGCTGRTRPPRNAVLITFDDGFRNNLMAAEILHELGIPALIFVLSDVVNSRFVPWYLRYAHYFSLRTRETAMLGPVELDLRTPRTAWRGLREGKEYLLSLPTAQRDDELERLREALGAPSIDPSDPDLAFVTQDDLRRLMELGMSIGGHSATHTDLSRCSPSELEYELVTSREKLAAFTGRKVEYMSYPDGRFSDATVALAQREYKLAFGADFGLSPRDLWRLPRRNGDGESTRVFTRWHPWERRAKAFVKGALQRSGVL